MTFESKTIDVIKFKEDLTDIRVGFEYMKGLTIRIAYCKSRSPLNVSNWIYIGNIIISPCNVWEMLRSKRKQTWVLEENVLF